MSSTTMRSVLAGLLFVAFVAPAVSCSKAEPVNGGGASPSLRTRTFATTVSTGATAPGTMRETERPGVARSGASPAAGSTTVTTTGGSAVGQSSEPFGLPQATPSARRDPREVLRQLHHDNRMKIEAGSLAQRLGESRAVIEFAAMLQREHAAADKKVMSLSRQKGFAFTEFELSPTADERNTMEELRELSGTTFDHAFASVMLLDHAEAVSFARAARDDLDDAEVRSLVVDILPHLEQHRVYAKKLLDGEDQFGLSAVPHLGTHGRRPVSR